MPRPKATPAEIWDCPECKEWYSSPIPGCLEVGHVCGFKYRRFIKRKVKD